MSKGKTGIVAVFRGKVSHGEGNWCSVSVLRNIKRACAVSIEKYDACLASNKANPMSCIAVLRDVCWGSGKWADDSWLRVLMQRQNGMELLFPRKRSFRSLGILCLDYTYTRIFMTISWLGLLHFRGPRPFPHLLRSRVILRPTQSSTPARL